MYIKVYIYIGWITPGCELLWDNYIVSENVYMELENTCIYNLSVRFNNIRVGDQNHYQYKKDTHVLINKLINYNYINNSKNHIDFYEAQQRLSNYNEVSTFTERLSLSEFFAELLSITDWLKNNTENRLHYNIVDDIVGEYLDEKVHKTLISNEY